MEPLIDLRNITKIYKMGDEEVRASDGVNLVICEGEFVAIVGQSGSGKSTLMNIIGCMDTMDSGSYLLSGIPIHQTKERDPVKIRNRVYLSELSPDSDLHRDAEHHHAPADAGRGQKDGRKRMPRGGGDAGRGLP